MSDTITRCPKCATSFRISEAHLKSAKGAVRCGSCLNVFNARENLVFRDEEPTAEQEVEQEHQATSKPAATRPTTATAEKKTQPPARPSPPKAPPPPPVEKVTAKDEDEDLLISDDMERENKYGADDGEDSLVEDFNSNVFSGGATISGEDFNLFERKAVEEDEDENSDTDESWAESLLQDDDDDRPLLRRAQEQEQEQEQEDDQSIEEEFSESYSRSPFQMIDEEPVDDEQEFRPNKPMYARSDPSFDSIDADIDEIGEDAYQSTTFESSNRRYIHSIEPEPVEFAFKKSYPLWYSTKLWAALSLLALIALVAQLAVHNFDRLSRIEPYRSYYASICPLVGCRLPPLVDRSRIRATNLVVRSHPNLKNALMVDAVLQNNANFPQTFPSLDLVFTNLQGEPVAARRFSPDQYLGGELAGRKDIPVRQPVHISLEIVDPGPKAVSYFIAIAD